MVMKLVVKGHPDVEIINTLEIIQATCAVQPDIVSPTGWSYVPGAGAEIAWDTQKTVERGGQKVFLGDDDGEYLESEIELIEVDPEEPCPTCKGIYPWADGACSNCGTGPK